MMIDPGSAETGILALIQDRGFQSEAAQLQAKSLLAEITAEVPDYRWTYVANRVVRNMTLATFDLQNLASSEGQIGTSLADAALRLALTWEALSKLREATSRETALLNAAINYDMAGYQANSLCLAKRIGPHNGVEDTVSLTELGAIFLQRRFLQVLEFAKSQWNQPIDVDEIDEVLIEQLAYGLASQAFSQASLFFLNGNRTALTESMRFFLNAELIFAELGDVLQANVSRSIRSLLPVMERRSTWTLLTETHATQPKWIRYLKLLARGKGLDILHSRSVSELWPSQVTALERGLLTSNNNKIVRMPTSTGKTRIAELAIVHTLLETEGGKCVYVAPYRALVSEVEESFLSLLNDMGFRASSVIGSYESDEYEESLLQDTDLLVTTPEKLDLVLRSQPEFLANLRLLILDEVHIVDDWERGPKFELLLTRIKNRLPNLRILALSAVLPDQTLRDFANWFNASIDDDLLTSPWRPAIQRYGRFTWRGTTGVIRYSQDVDVQLLQEFVPGVIRQQVYEYRNPETGRINRRRFPEVSNKAQIAAELAHKFAELGPVLIFCAQANFVDAVARALEQKLSLTELRHEAKPHYFQKNPRRRSAMISDEWLGDHPVTNWLEMGIGIHHGSLPNLLRAAIETDFRERNLQVLIATNTLAQGVNLPVRTIIVHSVWRYNSTEERRERLPARDFWNIAGRAGRAGEETEGLIIHLAINEQDEADFEHFVNARNNLEEVHSSLFARLQDLAARKLSPEAVQADLDPEILAILAEESIEPSIGESIESMIRGSLVGIQASRNNLQIETLAEVMTGWANKLADEIPRSEHRSVFSSTGLSSATCKFLFDEISANADMMRSLLSQGSEAHLNEILDVILPVCLSLTEMQPDREYAGSSIDLVKDWVRGVGIREITAKYGSEAFSLEAFGRFVDDLIRYRLPWGAASYVRIVCLVLGLERQELSTLARYLPTMIKFGLPDPIACWAMTAGIPYRELALRVSDAFTNEVSSPDRDSFRYWLGTLSSERLRYDFQLTSPILEDVSKSIAFSSANRLLSNYGEISNFLPVEVDIRGIAYENRNIAARRARVGQRANLLRDYDNLIDGNAIAVELSGDILGYIPREVAQVLAPEIDTGTMLEAIISKVEVARITRVSLGISLANP